MSLFSIFVSVAIFCSALLGQTKSAPKELFYDSDGNQVTNNEFVDIRLANFRNDDAGNDVDDIDRFRSLFNSW